MLNSCNHYLKPGLGEEEELFDARMNTNYRCMRCSRVYGLPFLAIEGIAREKALVSRFNVKGFQITFRGIVKNVLEQDKKTKKEVIQ